MSVLMSYRSQETSLARTSADGQYKEGQKTNKLANNLSAAVG